MDPPEHFLTIAQRVEELGFDYLWIADSSLHGRCVYSYLASAALSTERVRLGTGVTHPLSRHPAVTVNSIRTLDELSGGRAVLGLGAGDRPLLELGLGPAPVTVLEDTIRVARALLGGGKVTQEGAVFRTVEASLIQGGRRDLPIYVAASGPKTLEMAGRVADGVMIQVGVDPACVGFALDRVRAGMALADRTEQEVDIAAMLYGSVREDGSRAREESRAFAAWIPQTVPFYCELAGIPEEDVGRVQRVYRGGELMKAREAAAAVTDAMIDAFTFSGTPAECLERAERTVEAGVGNLTFFPMGEDRLGGLERFAEAVMAPLRS